MSVSILLVILIVVIIVIVVVTLARRGAVRNGTTKSQLKRKAKQRPDLDDFMK